MNTSKLDRHLKEYFDVFENLFIKNENVEIDEEYDKILFLMKNKIEEREKLEKQLCNLFDLY